MKSRKPGRPSKFRTELSAEQQKQFATFKRKGASDAELSRFFGYDRSVIRRWGRSLGIEMSKDTNRASIETGLFEIVRDQIGRSDFWTAKFTAACIQIWAELIATYVVENSGWTVDGPDLEVLDRRAVEISSLLMEAPLPERLAAQLRAKAAALMTDAQAMEQSRSAADLEGGSTSSVIAAAQRIRRKMARAKKRTIAAESSDIEVSGRA